MVKSDDLICRYPVLFSLPAIRPNDQNGIGFGGLPQSKVQHGFDSRLITSGKIELLILCDAGGSNIYFCSQAIGVSCRTGQFDLQKMVFRLLFLVISENESSVIDIVDHQIEIAVVIQIAKCSPVGKGRDSQPPGLCFIPEAQVSVIAEKIVIDFPGRHTGQHCQVLVVRKLPILPQRPCEPRLDVTAKIKVQYIFSQAVGNVYILEAVIIKICCQRGPAPVCVGKPRQLDYIAESAITVVEVKTIIHILVVIAVVHKLPELFKAQPFEVGVFAIVIFCGHV